MAYKLIPDEITSEEEVAGFRLMDIANPKSHYHGQPPTIKAAIYPCGPSHRVIKMCDPDGFMTYKLQQYGVLEGSPDWEQPDWLPVGADVDICANNAAEEAARLMRESPGPKIVSHVPPGTLPSE